MRQHPAPPSTRTEALLFWGVGVSIAIVFWFLMARWPDTPDGWIHLQRVRALALSLEQGQIYPRWFGDFGFGYGYPVLNYYAPAFYYPPALLHLAGLSVLDATRVTLAGLTGLAAVGMAHLARLWTPAVVAVVAALVYTASTYRLYDLFVRGALPEYAAFLWLPLLAAALIRVAYAARDGGATRQPAAATLIPAALLFAALIITHNLTAMMAGIAIFFVAVGASLRPLVRGEARVVVRIWLHLAAALLVGVLISAWYVIPALVEASWVGIGAETGSGYLSHFATMGSLFARQIPFIYPAAAEPVVPLAVSLGLLTLLSVTVALWRREQVRGLPVWLTLALLAAALWMITASSAWLWDLAAVALARLQFPWRWQAIAAPALALVAALTLARLAPTHRQRHWQLLAAATVALLAIFDGFGALSWEAAPWAAQPDGLSRARMLETDAQYGQVGASWTAEFLPRWVTEERWAIGREPTLAAISAASPVLLDAILLRAAPLRHDYRLMLDEPATIIFQTFYFPAWEVEADGEAVATSPSGALGLLAASLPAGESTVSVRWRATPAVQVGRFLTALGWVLILLLLVQMRRAQDNAFAHRLDTRATIWLAGWVAVGLLGLVAAAGWTERTTDALPLTADYGAVALAGVETPQARAGHPFTPVLHWVVREGGSDFTTFVHLLDAEGAIVAQNDAPLGGFYAPAERLAPGMILDVAVDLPLPGDLPPGDYTLRVGIYPPGRAEAPLFPAGEESPFVRSEQIRVTP